MLKQSNLSGPSYARHKANRCWSGATTPLFASCSAPELESLSDKDQPDRVTISRLWEVLDEPELNRALGIRQNSRMILGWKNRPLDDLARRTQALAASGLV